MSLWLLTKSTNWRHVFWLLQNRLPPAGEARQPEQLRRTTNVRGGGVAGEGTRSVYHLKQPLLFSLKQAYSIQSYTT